METRVEGWFQSKLGEIKREPSSGKVDTLLAEAALEFIQDMGLSRDETVEWIKALACTIVEERRYPAIALAAYISELSDDLPELGRFLDRYVGMKHRLKQRMIENVKDAGDYICAHEGDGLLIYGYSEPVSAILPEIFNDDICKHKEQVTVFVPEVRNRIHAGETLEVLSPDGSLSSLILPAPLSTTDDQQVSIANHSQFILLDQPLKPYTILRRLEGV